MEADSRGAKPLYRPREWQQQERRRRKLIRGASWYRPADAVLFLPVTPDSELASLLRPVVEEEGRRLGLAIRVGLGREPWAAAVLEAEAPTHPCCSA